MLATVEVANVVEHEHGDVLYAVPVGARSGYPHVSAIRIRDLRPL